MSETTDIDDLDDLEECELEIKSRAALRRSAILDVPAGADFNPVEEAILRRRSIRKFKGRQVPAHLIRRILEMGRFAPSQGNCQPWSFVVVRDRDMIARMEQHCVGVTKMMTANVDYTNYPAGSEQREKVLQNTQKLNRESPNSFHPVPMTAIKSIANGRFAVFHKAPTVILILMDKRGVGHPLVDIGIVGTNIVLAAHSLGLGTCWVGFSRMLSSNAALCEQLGIAAPFELAEAICVGYPIGNPWQNDISRQTHEIAWFENGEKQILY
jgi:nitroreductase